MPKVMCDFELGQYDFSELMLPLCGLTLPRAGISPFGLHTASPF